MLLAGQHERRVDLVADHPGAVRRHHVADALELGAAEHPPPRVVGLGQQQGAGAVGEEPVEPVEVDGAVVGVGVDDQVPALAAGDGGDVELRAVGRDRHHHRAGVGEHVEGQPDAGGDVDDREHVVGVDPVVELPRRPRGVRPPSSPPCSNGG